MTLGEKIKKYRKANKYSQEKIAELVGVSRQAVTKWESDQSAPSTDNLLKLANIYKISLDELTNTNEKQLQSIQNSYPRITGKKIGILWGIILVILLIISIFTFNSFKWNSFIWTLINLMILIGYIAFGIFVISLLIRALKKYIQTP